MRNSKSNEDEYSFFCPFASRIEKKRIMISDKRKTQFISPKPIAEKQSRKVIWLKTSKHEYKESP